MPRHCPHKTPPEIEEAILAIRRKHPRWGAKKILTMLERERHPGPLPGKTTVTNILKRHGCVTASGLEEDRRCALSAGYDHFLRKPYRKSTLFGLLKKHLGLEYVYQCKSPDSAQLPFHPS